ncbi:hypothetical protein LTH96_11220 [Nesterenkonia sp. LB17]|uniref:hypothetical protein n=1 Tax=unclassified Nesterenkonia TaxID=2629769 RepID=UPI001F4D0B91|nr:MULTISPECIES: hypothetical protein [unclassified Nesterenkonia]MCH8560751.1 hypothetical protein [Nesterenkonia sp. DZ6]MCH8563635.1 hypothetical protein [Nesterenkonia sp. YGD6]MCH8566283.1 hypothetical protein [Nesterenkonia sp. LB17]
MPELLDVEPWVFSVVVHAERQGRTDLFGGIVPDEKPEPGVVDGEHDRCSAQTHLDPEPAVRVAVFS